MISIDIPARKLELEVSESELEARRKRWKQPELKAECGFLERYRTFVTSGAGGAVFKD